MWVGERLALRAGAGLARRAAARGGGAVRRGRPRASFRRRPRRGRSPLLWKAGRHDAPRPRPIVILDFGGQYTQLIARRIREARVFSVVLPPGASAEEIRRWNPAGIILSGGPQSVYEEDAPVPSRRPDGAGRSGARPLLRHAVDGAGPGRQSGRRGARVRPRGRDASPRLDALRRPRARADGLDEPRRLRRGAAARGPRDRGDVRDTRSPASRTRRAASTPSSSIPRSGTRSTAPRSSQNFLFRICGARPDWTMAAFRQEKVEAIRRRRRRAR